MGVYIGFYLALCIQHHHYQLCLVRELMPMPTCCRPRPACGRQTLAETEAEWPPGSDFTKV